MTPYRRKVRFSPIWQRRDGISLAFKGQNTKVDTQYTLFCNVVTKTRCKCTRY